MTCPRCKNASLTELDRDGVTIDRCARCRGIWLDRGELEKLIAHGQAVEHNRDRDDNDGDDDDRRDRGRRRSWWEIFD